VRRRINIRQHDVSDCGVACLASVSEYYGRRLPLQSLRMYSGTTTEGTTILGLSEAAAVYGLKATGFKGESGSLAKVPLPAILHLRREGGLLHYVVLYRLKGSTAKIMDPSCGEIVKIKLEKLCREWTGYLIVVSPGEDFVKGGKGPGITLRSLKIASRDTGRFSLILTTSVLYILLTFSISLFIRELLDNILPSGNRDSLIVLSVLMFCVSLFSSAAGWARSQMLLRASVKIDKDLTKDYLNKIFKLPLSFFRSRRTGELISRVHEISKIRAMVTDLAINITISSAALLISFVLMFTSSARLGFFVLIFIPVYSAIYYFYDRYNRIARREILEEGSRFESSVVEGLRSCRSVKYYGLENAVISKICSRMDRMNRKIIQAGSRGILLSGSGELCSSLMMVAILAAGSFFVISGELSTGELVSFYTLASLSASPLSSLIRFNSSVRDGFSAAERLFEIMEMECEDFNREGEIPEIWGAVKFEDVSFRYPGRGDLLKSLNFVIEPGEITALCGESGCGKSTIAALLLRSERISGGRITCAGLNIEETNLKLWRSIVSVVPQEPELFSGTITENIITDDHNPDIDRVMKLCNGLGLNRFIAGLPFGADTRIGEGGVTLSRGQQQKISIARALYRNPSLLILDEATSSLDPESVKMAEQLFAGFKRRGTSLLMISHSREELTKADKILVVRDGKITEYENRDAEGAHSGLYPQAICGEI